MSKDTNFDVFISYSKTDKDVADLICSRLEQNKIKCWYAPRDIGAGDSYGGAIINAFLSVKVLVLIFTSSSNESVHVLREVERAINKKIKVIPFRIENKDPEADLEYFISTCQCIDAFTHPVEEHVGALLKAVKKILPAPQPTFYAKGMIYKWWEVVDPGTHGEDLKLQCVGCNSIKNYDPIFNDNPPDTCPVCNFDGEQKIKAPWYVIQPGGMGDRDITCKKCRNMIIASHYESEFVIPGSCPKCDFSG